MGTTADGYPWIEDLDQPANMSLWTQQAASAAQAVLDAHQTAANPHPGYLTPEEGAEAYVGLAGAQTIAGVADGCVVGSAIVKLIGEGRPVAEVLSRVAALAGGAHAA